jgi:hypothetical protein
MPAPEWTVITTPLARSERWAAWISARRGVDAPLLALAFGMMILFVRAPQGYGGVQGFLAGTMVATAFFLWERRGFRELLSRHEAELTARHNT